MYNSKGFQLETAGHGNSGTLDGEETSWMNFFSFFDLYSVTSYKYFNKPQFANLESIWPNERLLKIP